jgi:hypothetical protein
MTALLLLILACGTENWPQKTLTDPDGIFVAAHGPAVTVSHLRSANPTKLSLHEVQEVDAYVLGFKQEADEDLHVVVSDSPGWTGTMIVEFPSADCVVASGHAAEMDQARTDFLAIFGDPPRGGRLKKLKTPVRVKLTGVVFFDKIHGQTGVAPNGVELHPVLSVQTSVLCTHET